MKRRHGFVSNSSSSSFIVAFPKVPKSAQEVHEMLFPSGRKTFDHPYSDNSTTYPDGYPTKQVAETVFNDIQSQRKPLQRKRKWLIQELILSGTVSEVSSFFQGDEKRRRRQAARQEKAILAGIKRVDEFLAQVNEDALFMYEFEYADEDGAYFCALEHGNLFGALPHFRISKH